ncbi:universal stress protein [Oricola sp.]|uniref:universal stress protein n=1 Tax=Oricola sp. TaxID=1979950 RepID=UPI003BAA36A7
MIGFSATPAPPMDAKSPTSSRPECEPVIPSRQRKRFEELRCEFFATAGAGANSQWRQEEGFPTDALLRNSRSADLVISGTGRTDPDRYVDAARLVCGAGRPVLFVGADAHFRHPETALVGWKDSPEARRALAFALPFLRLARRVIVATVTDADRPRLAESLNDVIRYLNRHDIGASALLLQNRSGPQALVDAVAQMGVDLVVAGANAQSRTHNRTFGGFTRALLQQHSLTRLMAG